MNTIKLQQRGLLTLPKKIRDSLSLKEGQILNIQQSGRKIILETQTTTIDTELAEAITKGLADIKAGKFIEFSSVEEFYTKLSKYEN